MSTSRITLALVGSVLLTGPLMPPPVAAQAVSFVTAAQLFEPGTPFTMHQDWGAVCVHAGREPDGALVYAWENQLECRGQAGVWGYDLDGDAMPEVHIWMLVGSDCGAQAIRAWQWSVKGQWSEYVTGECVYSETARQHQFVYNYFSAASGGTCQSALGFLKQRNDLEYTNFMQALPNYNTNRLAVKTAWHRYNQANVTFHACANQLASRR